MEMPRCFFAFGSTYKGVVKIQRMSVENKALTQSPIIIGFDERDVTEIHPLQEF